LYPCKKEWDGHPNLRGVERLSVPPFDRCFGLEPGRYLGANIAEDRGEATAQEFHCKHYDEGNQADQQCVLRKVLTLLILGQKIHQ
jgi:hypothetical protein